MLFLKQETVDHSIELCIGNVGISPVDPTELDFSLKHITTDVEFLR